MNNKNDPDGGLRDGSSVPRKRPPQLAILVFLLFIEFLLVSAGAVYLLIELLIDTPQSYASAIAIFVITVLAAAWVGMIALHTLRGRAWTRGATVVWQVLQASIGVGSLQGLFARPDVGWPLIILSIVVLILLFTKPVLDATARGDEPAM
ncbi:MAG TPA: hypothetical protein VFT01_03570 [Homoserinimonas sp.]|nr:hypothetical protein [Homoserinimonas sp.]